MKAVDFHKLADEYNAPIEDMMDAIRDAASAGEYQLTMCLNEVAKGRLMRLGFMLKPTDKKDEYVVRW